MKRIILISAKQGAGKTTTAEFMRDHLRQLDFDVQVFKFAGILYQMHDACLPILKNVGAIDESCVKEGNLLQVLGTEYGRKHLGDDIWAKLTRRAVSKWVGDPNHPNRIAIIDDLRFPNELDFFKKDAYLVRLECSEEMRRHRCGAHWRSETNHPSEVALDGALELFHKVLFTTTRPVRDIAMEILDGAAKES